MLGRAALLGLALLLGGCTRALVLHDVVRGGSNEVEAGAASETGSGRDSYLACPDIQSVDARPRTAQVLVLLDYSTAMREPFESTTRLGMAQSAIVGAVHRYGRLVKFGLEQFPAAQDDQLAFYQCRYQCCAGSVHIPPDLGNESQLVSQIQCNSTFSCPPPSSTDSPSHSALDTATQYFNSQNFDYLQSFDDRYVWLVTASEPSCAAEGKKVCNLATYAANGLHSAAAASILTIGWVPDATRSCWPLICSALQPQKYKLPTGDCLNSFMTVEALNAYVQSFASTLARRACTMYLEFPVYDPGVRSTVTLKIDDQEVARHDASNPNGWDFEDPQRIELFGADCDSIVQSDESKPLSIDLSYPCSWCAGTSPTQCYPRHS
jgi:hypothetical protein